MSVTPTQYATAFWSVWRETPAEAQSRLMDGFLHMLSADGALKLWPEIEQALAATGMLRSARVARAQDQAAVAHALGRDATVSVEPQLVGGAVIRQGDTLVDGSVAGILQRLQRTLQGT